MHPVPTLLAAALFAAAGPALATAQTTIVLRRGADTVSVERFTRTPTGVEGDMVVRAMGARLRYALRLTPDGLPDRLENRFWTAADDPAATPRQTAVLTFAGDTAVVHLTGPGQEATQRIPSRAGAFAHVNPSFGLWEPVLAHARRHGVAAVPVFTLTGGQTFEATISFVGSDSALIQAPGGVVRLALDAESRILGGHIPAQGLVIERTRDTAAALRLERPDYSAPPGAPYTAQDVTVPTPMGHTLAGTLTLPRGMRPGVRIPAVVTITGSGGQDRDEAIPLFPGYRPFRELADALARRGIAVLRMDDRGIGASGGNHAAATSADFARDIRAGLAWLRTRPEIDPGRLALVGHSEGGIIAPLVALEEPDLRGLVLLAGTSRPGRQILEFQLPNLIRGDTSLSGAQKDSALARVPAMIDSMATSPWTRFFLDHDPSATARRVRTPVLILNGATDQQVTPDQAAELAAAFRASGGRDVTVHVFPGLNHLFVPDLDGFPGRYTELGDFRVSPDVLRMVGDWLAGRLLPPAG
jgi:uncharacterized protein